MNWQQAAGDRRTFGEYTVLKTMGRYLVFRGHTTRSATAECLGGFPTWEEAKAEVERQCK